MEAKEVVQKGYDLFGSGDMETFFGEIVHNDITVSYTHLTLPTNREV